MKRREETSALCDECEASDVRERLYTLTKIAKGDYLLPSNDARQLWRICRYAEDDGRETWLVAKYRHGGRTMPAEGDRVSDLIEWERWETWEASLQTRAEAIKTALSF